MLGCSAWGSEGSASNQKSLVTRNVTRLFVFALLRRMTRDTVGSERFRSCLIRKIVYRVDNDEREIMAASDAMNDRSEHFAVYVQLFGGTTAFSRRLGIDERAIRRFINGERPVSDGLLEDTGKALGLLIAEATTAQEQIAALLSADKPNKD